jgi:hypothetical protein
VNIATKDAFTWLVTCVDGSTIHEPAVDGFSNVERGQVAKLELLTPWEHGLYCVQVPEDAQAVFFRRRTVVLDPFSGQQTTIVDSATGAVERARTIHCIGWQRGDDAVYLFVMEDGSALLTNDLQAV